MTTLQSWQRANARDLFEQLDEVIFTAAVVKKSNLSPEELRSDQVIHLDEKMDFNEYVQKEAVEHAVEKTATSGLRYTAAKYGLRKLSYAIPYVGYAMLAYDLYSFGKYMAE